jgi:lipopolysaccharide transport system permease protein
MPAKWRVLFSLNPVVGVIDGFRWSLLGGQSPIWWPSVLMSILVSTLLCSSGIWYFRRTEKTFADII